MAKIENLEDCLNEIINLLQTVEDSRNVLFRKPFRENFKKASSEVRTMIKDKIGSYPEIANPNLNSNMIDAGLTGMQLDMKLESFKSSLTTFDEEGTEENLENVLEIGGTILNSLAGAIPGFGSFAQELIDFILKELKKRLRFWKRWW